MVAMDNAGSCKGTAFEPGASLSPSLSSCPVCSMTEQCGVGCCSLSEVQ